MHVVHRVVGAYDARVVVGYRQTRTQEPARVPAPNAILHCTKGAQTYWLCTELRWQYALATSRSECSMQRACSYNLHCLLVLFALTVWLRLEKPEHKCLA
eukprot:4435112-Amphidinium_carterae.3